MTGTITVGQFVDNFADAVPEKQREWTIDADLAAELGAKFVIALALSTNEFKRVVK